MTKSKDVYSPAFAAASLPMLAQSQKMLHVATRTNAQVFRAMMRYQIETLDFMKRRYERDLKLVDDLVAAEETGDAFDVLSTFWRNAAAEYASEASKVARIGSTIAAEAAGQVREEAETAIKDMAAQSVV